MQGQILGEMRRGGRLPRPALEIHDRNYLHVLRTGAMRQVAGARCADRDRACGGDPRCPGLNSSGGRF